MPAPSRLVAASLATLVFTSSFMLSEASAQDAPRGPKEAVTVAPASKGKTEIVKDTFASAQDEGDEQVATQASLQAGGLFSAGNARQTAVTGVFDLRIRRYQHQATAAFAGNYGLSGKRGEAIEETVSNLQALGRYDFFFVGSWAAFLQATGRRDKFQGLDLRANIDPGVAYYAIDRENERFWFEVGYDLQHDIRRAANLLQAAENGTALERTVTRHSGRGFIGYDNRLNSAVTVLTGLEYIQSVEEAKSWRINWVAALRSTLGERFSAATTFTLRVDNNPLPGVGKTDAITAVNLVYALR
jgi:putative salt-induced outer membrane protein